MASSSDTQIALWSEQIRQASANSAPLEIRGGGSKSWYGQQVCGELLSTADYQGVLSYEPSELVVTVKAGTKVQQLQQMLAQHQQMLAFEPPDFDGVATIGGMIATGLCGPRRYQTGPMRDYVLGVNLIDGQGEVLRFGGQVIKNVAGYDISRSQVGAMGSLGLITSVSLKVLPLPEAELTLVFICSENEAREKLLNWRLRWPVSASCWMVGRLYVRLSGYAQTLQQAQRALGGEVFAADDFWQALREQKLAFFSQEQERSLWRIALPLQQPGLNLPGKSVFEWGGQLQWLYTDVSASLVRQHAQACGAAACLYRAQDKTPGVFELPAPALWRVQQALRQVFDAAGIFNRGRLYDLDLTEER